MLRVTAIALQLIRDVAPLAGRISRRDAALGKQLRDALSSAVLNLEEAGGQHGGRRSQHYAIALGSAREAAIALEVAVAWGYIEETPRAVDERFRIVIATLLKLERG